MTKTDLSVAREFSRTPGSRYITEGNHSGEQFRESVLAPAVTQALAEGAVLHIDLDGTAGYGTSFLEEAFGGLVRDCGISGTELLRTLKFTSDEEPYLIEDITGYIKDAEEARTPPQTVRTR